MRNSLDSITARAMTMMQAGMEPGPEGSLNKLVSVRSRQKLSELAIDLQGATGLHFDAHAPVKQDWGASWITAPTGRIAGGADEMLLHPIAEKILGLPQDHRPDEGFPFNLIPACPQVTKPCPKRTAHRRRGKGWFSTCGPRG